MHSDLSSEILVQPSINPAAIVNGNATTTGATINTSGYESLTFVLQSGVMTDGTLEGSVFGGNAANMSDEVQLAAADLIGSEGTGPGIEILATEDNVTQRVGVNIARVAKQYYRLKVAQTGATTGGFFCASAILAKPRQAPTSTP